MFHTICTALLLSLIIPLQAQSLAWPQQESEFPVDQTVLFGQLDNGLLYAIRNNQEPPDKLSLRLFINAGSLNEQEAERGLAHFLEHLAFNGSEHFPPGTMVETLQRLGIAFGNHSNAHTGFDETVYKLDLPDPQPETLYTGLQVLSDTAGRLLLLPEEVEQEKGVILAEMRDRDGPGIRTSRALFASLYPGTILPKRFPIGTEETVSALDAASIRAFYERCYRPDQMVLSVVGAIDVAEVEKQIRQHFAELSSPDHAPASSIGKLTPADTLAVLAHHEAEADGTRVALTLTAHRSLPVDNRARRQRAALLDLATRIFDRRMEELIEGTNEAPLLGGGMGIQPPLAGLETTWIFGQAKPGRALEAAAVLVTEWRRMRQFGPTSTELQVAVADALAQLQDAIDRAATRSNAQIATELYQSVTDRRVYQSPQQTQVLLAPLYQQASPEQVMNACRSLEENAHRLLAVTGKDPVDASTEPTLKQLHSQAMQTPLQPPMDNGSAEWAYSQRPKAGQVALSEELPQGIRHLQFDNQAHVSLLPRVDKPNEVLIQLRLQLPPAPTPAGWREYIQRAFRAGGLGQHPMAELRVALAGSSASIHGPVFDNDSVLFHAACTPDELERTWQRLHAWLTDPGWREEAAQRECTTWLAELAVLDSDLDRMAGRRFEFLAHGGLPQRRAAEISEVRRLQWKPVRDWFAQLLATAPLEAAVVGDFDGAQVTEQATAYLGSLGKRQPLPIIPDLAAENALWPATPWLAGITRFEVASSVRRSLLFFAWHTDDAGDIHQARRLSVLAQVIDELLRKQVREELGDAYSPQAMHRASRAYEQDGFLLLVVSIAPERESEVRAVIDTALAALLDKGIDEDLFTRVIKPIRKQLVAYQTRNDYWLRQVVGRAISQPQRLEWVDNMIADYNAITATELHQLARRYLTNDRQLGVIAVSPGKP